MFGRFKNLATKSADDITLKETNSCQMVPEVACPAEDYVTIVP